MNEENEDTRTKILNAAYKLFSSQGYTETGVAQICGEANISKGGFFHYFPTKQSLFTELLENWLKELENQFEVLTKSCTTIPELLLAFSKSAGNIFRDARGQLPMFLEFWTQSSRDKTLWEKTIAPYKRYQVYFEELIRRGIKEKSLSNIDAAIVSKAIVAMGVGLLLQCALEPEAGDWPKVLEETFRIFLIGITGKGK